MSNIAYKETLSFSVILAQIISTISNPFIVLMLAFATANIGINFNESDYLLTFLLVGALFPSVIYVTQILRHKKHFLQFISLPQKERNPIYFSAIYTFLVNIILFAYLGKIAWVYSSLLVFIFVSLMYLMNRYIDKVSMHAAAFSFSIVYLIDKFDSRVILLLFFLPLIYWARITLHKHTLFQLLLGTVIGLSIGLISWKI